MIRQIIKIDEAKCNGCGKCVNACHEGAIGLVNGKAKLLRDDYCDGLGDCLPACPMNAITFEKRDCMPYNELAVKANKDKDNKKIEKQCTCLGSLAVSLREKKQIEESESIIESRLTQWPVQIKLAPINASYFNDADLLISADCAGYAYGDFHRKFMTNKVTLIGCPKLDMTDYSEKLAQIIKGNKIRSISIVRMSVPCCSGLEYAIKKAVNDAKKDIEVKVNIISTSGEII